MTRILAILFSILAFLHLRKRSDSWLAGGKYRAGNLNWGKDDCGEYWAAQIVDRRTGKVVGVSGSYYDTDETNTSRASRADQEAQLVAWGLIDAPDRPSGPSGPRRLFRWFMSYRARCIRRAGLHLLRIHRSEWSRQRAAARTIARAAEVTTATLRRVKAVH